MHRWGPRNESRVYIQASIHGDEIPGLLVANHLCHLLDTADAAGLIKEKEIVVVPYANPIGMSQNLLGAHMGRFALSSGTNFNRDWPDISAEVIKRLKDNLTETVEGNVSVIRTTIQHVLDELHPLDEEKALKHALYKLAVTSDLALDLHCDSDAVMHMYTHDNLWPEMADLAVSTL